MCQSRSASFSVYSHNLFKIILLQLSGVCPILPTAAECPPEPDNLCLTDAECPRNEKCCMEYCDLACFRAGRLHVI